MSTTPPSSFQPQGPNAYTTEGIPGSPTGPPPAPGQRNTVAIVALVVAVVGFVFAVWEGAYLLGWILLPIAFVLSIVALAGRDKPKKMAVAALVISIVGTVAGVIAFMSSAARIVDEAFTDTSPTVVASEPADDASRTAPSQEPADDAAAEQPAEDDAATEPAEGEAPAAEEEQPASELGTRAQPLALGSTIGTDEWQITVNTFTADATDEVLAANQFNEAPAEGSTYALANVTLTRVGAESGTAFEVSFDYITAAGNVAGAHDSMTVAPDPLGYEELFEGASVTGNVVFEIPAADAGVLRVTPGFFADEAFIATS